MHSEHLNNVRVTQLMIGWFIAVAMTSLLIFFLIALELLDMEMNTGGNWIAAAVALGFLAGGVYVGFMVALAPIVHGVLLGLISLLVWAILNAVVSLLFPSFHATTLTGTLTVNVILLQIIGATIGTRLGYRLASP